MMKRQKLKLLILNLLALCLFVTVSCNGLDKRDDSTAEFYALEEVPENPGEPYVEIDNNEPDFSEDELTTESYEEYSKLDSLGRCGTAQACVGTDLMPTEKRGKIGQIKPTGWHTVKYDNVDGMYLYNRCHLIGYQLSGENSNEKNLITGTRYFNVEGMLQFENMVADYVRESDNHVMYRVTPVFEEDNLVASGVQMEAKSVEDNGEGVSFNVFVYNMQPGIEIDYETGASSEKADVKEEPEKNGETYIINKNTHKFHRAECQSVKDMKPKNKKEYVGSRDELVQQGYEPCTRCNP